MNRKNHAPSAGMIDSGNRLEFMRFLADLSTRLIALPSNQIDDTIQSALVQCLEYFKIERLSLLKLLPDRISFMATYGADVSGTHPHAGATMSVSLFPWISKKLINGEIVSFVRPEELPAEADVDRQSLELSFQIRSGTFIPIAALRSSEYSFAITAGNYGRNCRNEHIPQLRLPGELFVNALERIKAELALRESEERLSLAASAAGRTRLRPVAQSGFPGEPGRPHCRAEKEKEEGYAAHRPVLLGPPAESAGIEPDRTGRGDRQSEIGRS